MLILTRKKGQSLYINDNICITVREVGSDSVRLAIDAPREVKILREELAEAMKSNKEAADQQNVDLSALKDAFIPRG
ncbi:MAG: carbon storage regulator CsrA [Clostridia bacterium]|nr:carbon storage regulator CsrA [Clostridia bacterium]